MSVRRGDVHKRKLCIRSDPLSRFVAYDLDDVISNEIVRELIDKKLWDWTLTDVFPSRYNTDLIAACLEARKSETPEEKETRRMWTCLHVAFSASPNIPRAMQEMNLFADAYLR